MEAAKQDAVVRSGRVSLDKVCRKCTLSMDEFRPGKAARGGEQRQFTRRA
jgi:hypothetical protein